MKKGNMGVNHLDTGKQEQSQDKSNLPTEKPLRINELISYLPGSAASLTLIKHAVGTVALFSFSAFMEKKGEGSWPIL